MDRRVELLQQIFNEQSYGEYAGATLTAPLEGELQFFVVGKGKSEEENFWIALNYIKYRSPGSRYVDALAIISRFPDKQDLAAKAMLAQQIA